MHDYFAKTVIESFILFSMAFWPAFVLGCVLHEAGHAIAAWMTGRRVIAFGLGHQTVLLRVPIRCAIFYFCWPVSGGITLWARPSLDAPLENFWIISGGLIANLIGVIVGVSLWMLGWGSTPLATWVAASALIIAGNAYPRTGRSSGAVFQTDGLLLWQLARGKRAFAAAPLGAQLSRSRAIIKLLGKIRHADGLALYRAHAALCEACLGNHEQARRDLDAGTNLAAVELPVVAQLRAVAEMEIALGTGDEQMPRLVDEIRSRFKPVASLQRIADLSLALWQLKRGHACGELVDTIRRQAVASPRDGLKSAAALVDFLADPTAEPETRCRMILDANPSMLAVNKIVLLTAAARQLAKLDRIDQARQFRDEANVICHKEASFIESSETRETFTKHMAAQLQAILPDEPIARIAPEPGTPAVRQKTSPAAATFWLGMASSVAGARAYVWGPISKIDFSNLDVCCVIAVSTCVAAFCTGCNSIVSRQRRIALILAGWLLGLAGVIACIAAYINGFGAKEQISPSPPPQTASAAPVSRSATSSGSLRTRPWGRRG